MKQKTQNAREEKKLSRKLPLPSASMPPNGKVAEVKPDPFQTIRILVVDDHPLFRHGLVQLLSSDEGFTVCGESGSAPEALSMIRNLNPSLVIADLSLNGPSGFELTKSIRAEFP